MKDGIGVEECAVINFELRRPQKQGWSQNFVFKELCSWLQNFMVEEIPHGCYMMDGIGIELCSSVLGMSDRAAQCIRCRLNDISLL